MENNIPMMRSFPLSSPPTSVSFPDITPNLTPNGSRVPDQSSISGSDWEILKSQLLRLVRDHGNVASDRFSIQKRRANLRQKRATSTGLGITLMSELNAHFSKEEPHPTSPSPLFTLFEQYQKSWTEYLVLENEYNDQEDRLDDREFQLEEVQEKLKKAVERCDTDKDAIADLVSIEDQENLVPSLPFESGEYHPLMAEYLSRRGTLKLVEERLWDLQMEHKEAYEVYKMGRGPRSSQPNGDDIDLLNNFKKYEDEILREREVLETEVEQLKAQCDKQGLSEDLSIPQISDSDSEAPISNPLQSLPAYKHVLWGRDSPRFFESAMPQDSVDTGSYINKWIFHQLCQSSLEVLQLKQSLGSQNLEVGSDEELRDLAMRYWKFDAAAKPVFRPISDACSNDSGDSHVPPANAKATGDVETKIIDNIETMAIDRIERKAVDNNEILPRTRPNLPKRRYSSLIDYNKQRPSPSRRQAFSAIFYYDKPFLGIT
ncbi:uncharacterized protein GIQ15_02083 [Arthroderma uncinatum]|uniref:uncharacterized protein n=1 Tax=Arthroderma uncinatum TaxID=74035 RepID=UPI00144ADBDA|nr:uncharacterized protein GIQ15_02083 [Arthroderma uncinatum]KAF3482759.1 hypothetical protein GIQ15_02083 [Arthroderma uncinatum]